MLYSLYKSSVDYVSHVLHYENCNIGKTAIVSGVTMASTVINIGAPFALLYVLPTISNDTSIGTTMLVVGSYTVTWGIGRVLPHVRNFLLESMTTEHSAKLVEEVIKKYFYLPKKIQTSNDKSDEVKFFYKIYNEVSIGKIKEFTANIAPSVLEITGSTAIIGYYYKLTGLELLGYLLTYGGMSLVGQFLVRKAYLAKENTRDFTAKKLNKLLGQYENAHYNHKVKLEIDDFLKQLKNFNRSQTCYFLCRDCNSIFHGVHSTGCVTGILLYAAYNVKTHNYTHNDFVWILFYLSQLAASLNDFSSAIYSFIAASTTYSEYLNYLAQDDVKKNDEDKKKLVLDTKKVEITFDNLMFSYETESEHNVLDGISFAFASGKKYAVVGASGSGKSTIIEMLYRFRTDYQGSIKINGQDLTDIKLESLRRAIAVVPQHPNLFNDTIIENIKYGADTEVTAEVMAGVIEIAGLKTLVEKYGNKTIGEDGKEISGGQRKRIAIAQALLKMRTNGSPVMILDEATAGIDAKTEAEILNNVYAETKDKIVIIITHNLPTLKDVDHIFVMNSGKIVEEGTYDELSKIKEGFFTKLAELEERPRSKSDGVVKLKEDFKDTKQIKVYADTRHGLFHNEKNYGTNTEGEIITLLGEEEKRSTREKSTCGVG